MTNNNTSTTTTTTAIGFHLFTYLSDDLKQTVLSFVADAPLESMPENYPRSALTNELPIVSKKFHTLTQCDYYWKNAIERQTVREPLLWRKALVQICKQQQQQQKGSDMELIEKTHSVLGKPSYKSIYQHVVSNHLRYKGPVFCMFGQIQLGCAYEVNTAAPTFRRVLDTVLRDVPADARNGVSLRNRRKPIVFVHCNRGPLARSTPAVLVQVLMCQLNNDDDNDDEGESSALLLPIAHVWIERVWEGEKENHANNSLENDNNNPLILAQCLKMGHCVAADMNRLARQEALVRVMDQLAEDIFENHADVFEEDDDEEEDSYESSDFDTDEESLLDSLWHEGEANE